MHLSDARMRLTLALTAASCVIAAAVVLVAGPADGPWLCVPVALGACAGARTARGGLAAAATVLAAGLVAMLADANGTGRAPPALLAVVGDSLLRDVANALQRAMRAQDTVARFGGDEFCVLAPETDANGTERLASRITQAVDGVTVGLETVHASLGVALFPFDGSATPELLDAADQRLLEAKRRLGSGRRAQRRSAA